MCSSASTGVRPQGGGCGSRRRGRDEGRHLHARAARGGEPERRRLPRRATAPSSHRRGTICSRSAAAPRARPPRASASEGGTTAASCVNGGCARSASIHVASTDATRRRSRVEVYEGAELTATQVVRAPPDRRRPRPRRGVRAPRRDRPRPHVQAAPRRRHGSGRARSAVGGRVFGSRPWELVGPRRDHSRGGGCAAPRAARWAAWASCIRTTTVDSCGRACGTAITSRGGVCRCACTTHPDMPAIDRHRGADRAAAVRRLRRRRGDRRQDGGALRRSRPRDRPPPRRRSPRSLGARATRRGRARYATRTRARRSRIRAAAAVAASASMTPRTSVNV